METEDGLLEQACGAGWGKRLGDTHVTCVMCWVRAGDTHVTYLMCTAGGEWRDMRVTYVMCGARAQGHACNIHDVLGSGTGVEEVN